MRAKTIEKYFFVALLLVTLIFTFFIFRPFWITIVLGICFSIVLYPIYAWLERGRLPRPLASLITVLVFLIILIGPILGIGVLVLDQSQSVYSVVVEEGDIRPYLDSFSDSVSTLLPPEVNFDINKQVAGFVSYLSDNVAKIFSATVSAFFSFVLMLLIIFYFLKDGDKWKKAVVVLSPLADTDDEKIIAHLTLAVNAVIKGYLLIALSQGLVLGLGLWIFGVPNAALWGVVAAVASLIPTLGTSLVSIPAIIYLFLVGNVFQAVGLIIWAAFAVGMIDNFLAPYVVGGKINIPPLLILFSILGGIALLGPVGLLVGPLALSLLYALIAIYRNEFTEDAVI